MTGGKEVTSGYRTYQIAVLAHCRCRTIAEARLFFNPQCSPCYSSLLIFALSRCCETMSRTFEVGRAVLSSSAANVELWLTTLITILPQQAAIDMQQLKSDSILDYLLSENVWVGCGHHMHIDLNITLQEEPLVQSQRRQLIESMLRAPVCASLVPKKPD